MLRALCGVNKNLDRIRPSMRTLLVGSDFWALLNTIPVSDVHFVTTADSLEASSETQRT